MNHRLIVSWIFRVGALLVGIPALLMLIDIGLGLFTVTHAVQHAPQPQWVDVQKYGLVGLIANGGQIFGGLMIAFATLGLVVAILFAFMLVLAIFFAILFFFTGRGVAGHADWARVMGIVLSALCLLIWLAGVKNNTDHMPDLLLACTGVAISAYAIWTLGWRYT
jgi:hypothetical protein